MTEHAFRAGLGHNVDGGAVRIAALEGHGKACVFPVFYEDRLGDIIWSLDYSGIAAEARARETKQDRLSWLLAHHSYLPNLELASLSGMSQRSVDTAAAHARSLRPDRLAA